jgi:Arc/MetJ-type ribon-helix-helix transcriptional regulator
MARAKIAITLDQEALGEIERLVAAGVFPNCSKAIEAAVEEKLARLRRSRLAIESAKLDTMEERAMADEGYGGESGWPEY